MLTMTGESYKVPLVRSLIEGENAFVCRWDKVELRVAFHKGCWYLVKFKSKKLADRLEATDAPKFETDNTMLKGLVDTLSKAETETDGDFGLRNWTGRVLTKTISVWCGNLDDIYEIECLQVGRNSFLNEDGEFSFSPDKKI